MKTSNWFAIALAAAVAAGGLIAFSTRATDDSAPPRPLRGRLLERVKEKLALTDEQTARIGAVLKADAETLTRLLTQLHQARVDLREAIQSPDATEASVRAASAKVAAVEADLAVERFKLHGRISPILTADQRQKLDALEARWDDFVDQLINRIGERLAE